jgi:hypothetical protein
MVAGATVLGILGGGLGALAGLVVLLIAGLGGGADAAVSGLAGLTFGMLGITGGAITRNAPRAALWCLAIACIGGAVAVQVWWLPAGPLLLLGAVLAWRVTVMRGRDETAPAVVAG